MNINPDDPKWTAYVLGELSELERAEMEKDLDSSAAAREVVEEIRLTTGLLRAEFAREAPLTLSPEQKGAAMTSRRRTRPVFVWAAAMAIAAAVVLVAFLPQPRRAQPLAAVAVNSAAVGQATPGPVDSVQEEESQQNGKSAQSAQPRNKLRLDLPQQLGQQGQQATQSLAIAPAAPKKEFGDVFFDEKRIGMTADAMSPLAASAPASVDRPARPPFNTESYDLIPENPFVRASQEPLATFSIDVDTASYANMRRFLAMNTLPPKDSIRIEELINYFSYDYPSPTGSRPIGAYSEVAAAPWKPDHRLVRIGVKAKDIDVSKRPPSNLVFLIDVSGSMATPEKLPLLQSAMKLMTDKLSESDHVAIVTYAGQSGLRLPTTNGDKKQIINSAIDSLTSGGSTNGAAGIQMAYQTAMSSFIRGGINRVILATDGDFNVGVTSPGDLVRLIEEKAQSGVFLSVLGFGMGNFKDSTLEKVADKGNGNYAYIDTLNEARKVLVEEMSGTLVTVAKDVKIQVEFNPAQVNAYRLIGYENRALRSQDFNDDRKDAGEMGAGQTVTALFEVVPRGVDIDLPAIDALKYQQPQTKSAPKAESSGELLNVKIRYKQPEGTTSQSFEVPVLDRGAAFNTASTDFRFVAAVASFGMILRESPHRGAATLDGVLEIAEKSKGGDRYSYRTEFVDLVRKARSLK